MDAGARPTCSTPRDDQSGFNTSETGITGDQPPTLGRPDGHLPAGTNALRCRYQTDGAVAESGFRVDDIALDGTVIGTAETADEGWTFDGFRRTTGTEDRAFFNAYVAENRQYDGYDTLAADGVQLRVRATRGRTGWRTTRYQDGLLLIVLGRARTPTTTSATTPGAGLILPVDAHPAFCRTGRTAR